MSGNVAWVGPAACFAAGTCYGLRDLKIGNTEAGQMGGLAIVVLLWFPITLFNIAMLCRPGEWRAALGRFFLETVPPSLLWIAIVALSGLAP